MTTYARRWALDSQLLVAIQNNDVSRAHQLFQAGVDTDTRFSINSQKRPALCICVENNALDMVKLLVERGVSINQGDSDGVTPLHIACSHSYPDLAALLLRARANVNARTNQGHTPLHLAAMRGNSDLVELLLSYRANVDVADADGCTPLHHAAASNNPDVVTILAAASADLTAIDSRGNSPLHYAAIGSGITPDVIRTITEADTSAIGLANRNMETPLHIVIRSARHDAERVLEVMLESATKEALNSQGPLGHTPLHLAVLEHRISLLRLLLTAGADTETEDDLGHTPLVSAARDGIWGAIALLLAAGARTRRLIQGGDIESEIQDLGIRALLQEGTRQPPRLSSVCRRALTCYLGPNAFKVLSKASLPPVWHEFLTFQTVNL
ncbi:ankyrin repeat and protein kinase domain-containing protein 1-like isoform X1 [Macrobrachium rosenbergii]|uniref:ankyrin repeat and protein kinase domain-containing protein 1-like isoform X1 n=1 Tax=Macrobrachium rosenbergii TaxID=79674 RepID=UPI0034D3DE30